jgi:hypothetical protein
MSHNSTGHHGLLQGYLYFFLLYPYSLKFGMPLKVVQIALKISEVQATLVLFN